MACDVKRRGLPWWRVVCVLMLGGLLLAQEPRDESRASGEPTSQPTSAPALVAAQAPRSAELAAEIQRLRAQGQYATAVPLAKELLALSTRIYGEKHWQTGDARRVVETLGLAVKLSPAAQAELAEADRGDAEVARLNSQGKNKEAAELAGKLLAIRQRHLPAQHLDVAKSLGLLGDCLMALNRCADAYVRYVDAADLYLRAIGADHPSLAASVHNLGWSIYSQGRNQDALAMLQGALSMRRRLFGNEHADVATSLNAIGLCLDNLGRREEALKDYQEALAIRRQVCPGDDAGLAASLNNVGSCLESLGRHEEALQHHQEALAMRQRLYPGGHLDVATSLNNIGNPLTALNRHAEALDYYQQALAMYRRLYAKAGGATLQPGDHAYTVTTLNNLARCLSQMGRQAEALPHHEEALAMQRRLHGGDHPDVAATLYSVANCLADLGRFDEALKRYQEVMELKKRLRGGDHAEVAQAADCAGFYLLRIGRTEEALQYYQDALAMRQRLYAGDHNDVAMSMGWVATCLSNLGRHAEALRYQQDQVAMCRRLLGNDNPVVAMGMVLVGTSLNRLGRATEALEQFQEALGMYRRSGRGDDWYSLTILNEVAQTLVTVGRADEALEYYQQALETNQRLRAAAARQPDAAVESQPSEPRSPRPRPTGDDPLVASSLNVVGNALLALGRAGEALKYLQDALAMNRRLHPGDDPEVATTLNDLANAFSGLGRFADALRYHEDSLAMRQRLYAGSAGTTRAPGDHPEVATSLCNVGHALAALGRPADALEYHQQSLAMNRRLYASDHWDTATALNNVGLCLGAVGRAEEALQYSQDALAMYQRLYPGDHWHTAISLNNVAICLSAPGRPAEALEYYQKALAMFQRLYRGDHPAIAKGLNNVAVCLESLGRAAEAQPLYEEAVAMSRRQAYPEFHFWAANLARVYLGLDRAADAATLLTEAITQIESLRAAARGLSEQERAAYFTALKQYGAFETMVRAQLLLGNGDEALRYLEKGRARSLLDLLERSRFDPLQQIARRAAEQHDDPLLARIRQIQAALERADQEVGRLEHEIAMTRARRTEDEEALHKKQADLERLFAEQRAARVKQSEASRQWFELVAEALQMSPAREPAEIRQLLSPGQRLLIYSVTNADALLLVVPPPGEQIRGYRLTWPDGTKVTYDSLTATVEEYLRAIVRDGYATQRSGVESRLSELKTVTNLTPAQRGEIEDLNDTLTRLDRASLDVSKSESSGPGAAPATALGERLFAALIPLEVWAEIKDARLVYVVSDGALHRLPFETLIVSGGDTAEQRRYWLDDGPPIVYGPSGSALLWSQQRRSEQLVRQAEHAPLYEAVALGDPIFNRDPSQDAGLPLPDTGVLVLTVPPDSAASAAGLARGDVIVSYDGQNVADDLELQDRITEIEKAMRRAQRTREPVPLAVWRAGHQRELTIASGRLGVELATVPPPQAIAAIQGDTFDPKTMAVERGNLLTRYGGLEPLPGTRREVASIYRTLTGQDYSPSPAPVAAGLRTGRSGPEAPPASQPAGTNVAADVPVGRPAERPRGGAPASAPAATQPVRVLLGEDATETELYATAPQARFLHLATHQLADETEFASYSSLALTLPPVMTAADNGFLKLVDLFEHWRDRISRCELVVLSACETQRGRLQRDEGVFALPWGFMYAGAPSIVASLWRVNDVSTAELMSTFYERLRGGGHESKLSAFTEARRQLRRRYAEPYFWAPFVYMGDPR